MVDENKLSDDLDLDDLLKDAETASETEERGNGVSADILGDSDDISLADFNFDNLSDEDGGISEPKVFTEAEAAAEESKGASEISEPAFVGEDAVDENNAEAEKNEDIEEGASLVEGKKEGGDDQPFSEVGEDAEDLTNSQDFSEETASEASFEDESDAYFENSLNDGEIMAESDAAESRHYLPQALQESGNIGALRWYSGNSADKFFEIAKGFESTDFNADEECKAVHVNVGYDTYGWEVQFSDGTVMNLRDVREYQIRNGCLPSSEGRIVYGQSSLSFSGIERIVVYESIKYFSYGI